MELPLKNKAIANAKASVSRPLLHVKPFYFIVCNSHLHKIVYTPKYQALYLIENWFIFLTLLAFILYTFSNLFLGFNIEFQYFVDVTIREALNDLKSSLLSVTAIFIGIYVTVFTLLGSIKVDSIFAFLNEYTFKKLIKFIRNAFIASFSYLVLVMVLEVSYANYNNIDFMWIVLNASLVIYMLLTALRFGIILYIAFRKDLNNLQENIEKHRRERTELKKMQHRINNLLDEYEKEKGRTKAEEMSKIINRNKK